MCQLCASRVPAVCQPHPGHGPTDLAQDPLRISTWEGWHKHQRRKVWPCHGATHKDNISPMSQAMPGFHCSASPGMLCPGLETTHQHIPGTLSPTPWPWWEPGWWTEPGWSRQLPPGFGTWPRSEFPWDKELEQLRRGVPAHSPRSSPVHGRSCRAVCQSGAITCSGAGRRPEPF